MNTIDIIIISIIVVGAVFGMIRGFIKSLFSLVGYIIAMFCIKAYSKKLADFLVSNTSIFNKATDLVVGKLSSISVPASSVHFSDIMISGENRNIGMLPFSIDNLFKTNLMAGKYTIAEFLVNMLLLVISSLLIFIVVKAIFMLIAFLLSSLLKKNTVLNTMNRLLGMLLGTLTSIMIIGLLTIFTMPFVFMAPDSILSQMLAKSIILNFVYKSSIFTNILNGIMIK